MLPLDERGRATAARLEDRYTFEGFLGQGGFAAVYRVRNLRLDRVEALKVLFEARGSDPKFAAANKVCQALLPSGATTTTTG